MILDTSGVVAIFRREESWESLADAILADHRRYMSAASVVELTLVLSRFEDLNLPNDIDIFIQKMNIEVVEFDWEQLRIARRAFLKFGKGRGHPARLNFGDCFSYALAIYRNEPLLFVGNDFIHTDVRVAEIAAS